MGYFTPDPWWMDRTANTELQEDTTHVISFWEMVGGDYGVLHLFYNNEERANAHTQRLEGDVMAMPILLTRNEYLECKRKAKL